MAGCVKSTYRLHILLSVALIFFSILDHAECKVGLRYHPKIVYRRGPVHQFENDKPSDYFSMLLKGMPGMKELTVLKNKFAESRQYNSMKGEEAGHGQDMKIAKDTTLDDLLEVMGPHLFLIPFVMNALPFAIPALPFSYILSTHAPPTFQELLKQAMEFMGNLHEQQEIANGSHEG